MIEYSPLDQNKRPHRLVAQDEALSRLKPGFEFPWGHTNDSHPLREVAVIFKGYI